MSTQMHDDAPREAISRAELALQAGRTQEARVICEGVLAAVPDYPPAVALEGVLAGQAGHLERAAELLQRAVRAQPGVASWYAKLCGWYRLLDRPEDAVAAGNEALRLAPEDTNNLVNLGLAFAELRDDESAQACLLRAIGLAPTLANAHLALAESLLARGEFGPGWSEYEWRNQIEAGRGRLPKMTSAPWNGMRIPKGRILLVGDQGYGDTIQFARYIPLVAERCAEVVVGCSAELAPLLARVPGVASCFRSWDVIPGHAAHAQLSSLPGLFQTRIDTIPAQIPYLRAEPACVEKWAQRLARSAPRPLRRIGLAWSGRKTHPNDRRRSQHLAGMMPLAATGPATFFSLQKPFPHVDLAAMAAFPGLTDLSDELVDFEETAALIANLDLLVTVDTSVAHLAGALGIPVWVMLPWASDWRWLRDRTDSPWYPTMRLFRQSRPGAWPELVAEVAAALRGLVAVADRGG